MRFLAELHVYERVGPFVASFASFAAYAAGLGLVAGGAWLVLPAAGLITGGVLLTLTAIAYERHSARGADEEPRSIE